MQLVSCVEVPAEIRYLLENGLELTGGAKVVQVLPLSRGERQLVSNWLGLDESSGLVRQLRQCLHTVAEDGLTS